MCECCTRIDWLELRISKNTKPDIPALVTLGRYDECGGVESPGKETTYI